MSKNYDALTVRFKTPEERSALARAKTIASNRNQSASKFVSDLLARELDGEQDDWTRQMTGFDLDKSARALAEAVTAVLRTTDDWAKQAIVKGQFIPPWAQVFGTRSDQTRREKEHLGQQFSECLCARLEALISTHDQIYLIVDSGTTMYWLVVKFLARLKSSSENLIDKLVIVTNNMPALDAYLSYYRSASETRVECRILPGAALPIYAAVVGAEARNALRDYRNKAQREKTTSYFIGLVAGKWIRISTDNKVIPMSKTAEHREFKGAVLDSCDEAYVLVSLSKTFVHKNQQQVNDLLTKAGILKAQEKYLDVDQAAQCSERLRLVSTARTDGPLAAHSGELAGALIAPAGDSPLDKFGADVFSEVPHTLFDFDPESADWEDSLREEFPDLVDNGLSEFASLRPGSGILEFLQSFRVQVDNKPTSHLSSPSGIPNRSNMSESYLAVSLGGTNY